MNYIIFDLEWNQRPCRGAMRALDEILEIGAVKLGETGKITQELSIVVRPSVYRGLHPHVKKIVHLDESALAGGVLFEEAARRLRAFCGTDYAFFSWGDEDAAVLIQNLAYYGMPLEWAARHYDLQRVFYQQLEREGQTQRALAWCVESLGVRQQEGDYHSALTDARYAAQIFMRLDIPRALRENDGLYLPGPRRQKAYYARFRAQADPRQGAPRCPVCRRSVRAVADVFSFGAGTMIAVARCPRHGYFSGVFSRAPGAAQDKRRARGGRDAKS